METKRILVDAHWFDEFYSGVTTYIKNVYSGLVTYKQYKIYIVAKNIERLKENFTNKDFIFLELPFNSKLLNLLFGFPFLIWRYKIDIAHFQYLVPPIKLCKYIVTIHDLLFITYPQYFSKKFIIQKSIEFYFSSILSNKIFTVSEYSKNAIIKYFHISQNKITITRNGIELLHENKSSNDISLPSNVILYVSRIEIRKNHLLLLKAFVELELFNYYNLVFIGKKVVQEYPFCTYYERLNENIKNHIIIIENVSEEVLYSYYSNAKLFVYPSFAEGFGIPPLEALSVGTKVLCSNSTALSDFSFLKEYQFDPNDLNELKIKILTCLTKTEYPIDELQEYVLKNFTWDQVVNVINEELINFEE